MCNIFFILSNTPSPTCMMINSSIKNGQLNFHVDQTNIKLNSLTCTCIFLLIFPSHNALEALLTMPLCNRFTTSSYEIFLKDVMPSSIGGPT